MKAKKNIKLAAMEKDASLKKGGINKKYASKVKPPEIETEQPESRNYFTDNDSLNHISDMQVGRDESTDAIEGAVGKDFSTDDTSCFHSSVEDEEVEYAYDDVIREIHEDICLETEGEVNYTYDSLIEENSDLGQYEPVEEERDYIYEDIMEEVQGKSPPGTEEVEYTYNRLVNELQGAQYSEVEAPKGTLDHKENNDMDESRMNPKRMIPDGEMSTYLMARKIIRKYGLKRLSKTGTTVWGYNGKSYEPLDDQKLGELIYSEIPEAVKLEVSSCARIKKNVIEFIRDELAQAVKQGNRNFYFSRKDFKGIMGKVVLQNGVFDIRSGLLEGFDATKPYYYELNATYLEVHDDRLYTPAFDKLISDACGGDKESILMTMQVLGRLLLPDPSKKFPVVGPASNSGKSLLFGSFIEEVLPRARISHVATSELKDKFALGNAEDMLLISCMDVDLNTISAATAGVIKRATGEDVISVQDKYKPRKDIDVRFKFVFGTNGMFCTQKDDAGWQNRILAVPFIHETPEEEMDMHLLDKLLEEKDAIVTKVLRAMASVIAEEGELKVKESELSIKLKYSWTTPNDYFDEFMSEMVEITGTEEDNYSTDEIYEAYCQYYICSVRQNREYHNNVRLSQKEFVSNVLKYGRGLIEKKRVKQNRKEHFKNSQHRLCGLLLKSADILDTDDIHESET